MKKIRIAIALLVAVVFAQNVEAQAPNTTAKFGKGIRMLAADSSFALNATFRFQTLFTTQGVLGESDWGTSMKIRRSRIKMNGWVYKPEFGYKVELALSNNDLKYGNDAALNGGAPKIVLDAVFKWKPSKHFEFWAGQTKLPGNRERVISSQKLQFVDRTLVNSYFNIDRDLGIHFRGKMNTPVGIIKPIAAISMGEGRNIIANNVGGFNYTGRLEWLPMGSFTGKGDYFGSDLKREEKPKLSIGATYNFNDGSSKQKPAGSFLLDSVGNYLENDITTTTVDAIFKYKGFSVETEYTMVDCPDCGEEDLADGETPSWVAANGKTYNTGDGFTIQAGYLMKNNWEPALRYTQIDSNNDYGFAGITEYTLGLSRYIVGHSLKFQSDVSYWEVEGSDDQFLRYRLQMEIQF